MNAPVSLTPARETPMKADESFDRIDQILAHALERLDEGATRSEVAGHITDARSVAILAAAYVRRSTKTEGL